jgi:sugar lactone lactonase YvrE
MPAANGLSFAIGVAIDPPTGRLFAADANNNRVLSWPTAAAAQANSQAPDLVLGQADFTSLAANRGGPVSASGMNNPQGLGLNGQGRLYVADYNNNRVLEYDTPLSSATANRVFGQNGSFTTTNTAPVTANSLYAPESVALDVAGHLYVADYYNNRVLEYDRPLPLPKLFLPLVRR